MGDLKKLRDAIESTRQAIATGDVVHADTVGKGMCDLFESEYIIEKDSDYTPDMAALQFECLAVLLDLHILRGEPWDITIRHGQILKKYKMDRGHFKSWTDADWKEIDGIIMHTVKAVEQFRRNTYRKIWDNEEKKAPDIEHKCALCRKEVADKTGSHMVPHFLIARTFSFDGSTDREKVVVESDNLATGEKDRFFGHQVYDDTVNELLGRSFTDEEIEVEAKKRNALTRDYVFCSDCEKRFGVIESYYSDILEGKISDYPPQIPYLFWLSVAWRMSIGGMGFKMEAGHEEKLRRILDRCLSLEKNSIVTDKSKLGYCAYTLHRAVDTKDERLGILAIHSPTKPYFALIGNMLFNFFVTSGAAYSHYRRYGMPASDINTGEKPERIGLLDFIEFWMVKRKILDENWKEERSVWNMGRTMNQTLSKYEPDSSPLMQSAFGEEMEDVGLEGIPTWFNSENPMVVTYPRSILKIIKWSKDNPDKKSLEEMAEGTGYSVEELHVMLDYFLKKMNKQLRKMDEMEEQGEQWEKLLDLF